MKKDEVSNSFQTSDFPLVATLVTLGFQIDSLDTSDPSRVVFTFIQTTELIETIESFWSSSTSVEPKYFCNIQRELKARIRSEHDK